MKKSCKLTIFSSILPPNCIFSMDDWWQWGSPSIYSFLNPEKLVFLVINGKFWIFENFQICLTSEALVPLLCFPKARKMFVCREELQMMFLSTEQPHVGEPRYGPPKFFFGILENAISIIWIHPDVFILPKWYSVAPIDLIWKTMITVVILAAFDRKTTCFELEIV